MENLVEIGPELPTKEDVINVLKRDDVEEADKISTLNRWVISREEEADGTRGSLLRIKLNIELVEIYLAVDRIDFAKSARNDVWTMICNELPREGEIEPPELLELWQRAVDLRYEVEDAEGEIKK